LAAVIGLVTGDCAGLELQPSSIIATRTGKVTGRDKLRQ
jgi:hypothetical protein